MNISYLLNFVILLSVARIYYGQTTTMSQSGCSYTFLVSRQPDSPCPVGSEATGSDNKEIDYLKSVVMNQQEQLANQQEQLALLSRNILKLEQQVQESLTEDLQKLQDQVETLETAQQNGGSGDVKIGSNYVRWGRTSCPGTAELIYEGYAAKSYHLHTGGGTNYICLDKNPKWPNVTMAGFQSQGHLHGVEYQTLTGLDSSLLSNDAPCAVCHVEGRGEHLMIPGNRTCPLNWTKEYEGLLVSEQVTKQKATYVCLDGDPEVVTGGGGNANGGLFYTVEVDCGYALPCPPFIDGYEVACVVCTH